MHIHELKRGIKYRISKAEAFLHKLTLTRLSLLRNKGKSNRKLEIGPSFERIEGFETLNISPNQLDIKASVIRLR